MPPHWQERIASLIAAAGMAWGVKVATANFTSVRTFLVPTGGPLELCGLGILFWIYAKWRRAVVLH